MIVCREGPRIRSSSAHRTPFFPLACESGERVASNKAASRERGGPHSASCPAPAFAGPGSSGASSKHRHIDIAPSAFTGSPAGACHRAGLRPDPLAGDDELIDMRSQSRGAFRVRVLPSRSAAKVRAARDAGVLTDPRASASREAEAGRCFSMKPRPEVRTASPPFLQRPARGV